MIVGLRIAALTAAFAASMLVASATAALASGRVALVVGNAHYAELGTLANPTNDAQDIAATLRGMGFQVVETDDADERKFTSVLSDFATAAQDADIALFYYSGHGLQYQSENYLVPVDATLENRFSLTHETIPLDDVLSAVSGARSALLFIDACRSFPITGTFLASPNERVTPVHGLAAVDTSGSNTFIGFSASAGQTARDGSGRNSPFTTAMLEEMTSPGLDVTQMFTKVSAQVVAATGGAQKPQQFGTVSGDVTLVAGAATPNTPAAPDPEQQAYHDAAAIGTLGAYRAFIARYPGGMYSEFAREAMDKLQADASSSVTNPTASIPAPSTPCLLTQQGCPDTSSSSQEVASVTPPPRTLTEPDLTYFGPPSQTIGDWQIASSSNGCFMFTEAQSVSPEGWLTYRPWIYFGVTKNSGMVQSSLIRTGNDGGGDYFANGDAIAETSRSDNSIHRLSTHFLGPELRLVVPCTDKTNGEYCLDGDDLTEMMAGNYLRVRGTNPAGQSAAVIYGIQGYTDAAKRINQLCNAQAQFLYGGVSDTGTPTAQPPAPLSLPAGIREPNLSSYGKTQQTIGAWHIAQANNRCTMSTEAQGVTPSGWLTYRPWLYFSTGKNQALVWSAMITAAKDDGSDIFRPGTVRATVTQTDGTSQTIPAVFDGKELQALSPCDDKDHGNLCVDDSATTALMSGAWLTLSGATPSGDSGSVTYALDSYVDAAKRINGLCNAQASYLYGE